MNKDVFFIIIVMKDTTVVNIGSIVRTYSIRIGFRNRFDKVWVKHWEYKSSITFKLLSLQM
jgi:hypothetical protein